MTTSMKLTEEVGVVLWKMGERVDMTFWFTNPFDGFYIGAVRSESAESSRITALLCFLRFSDSK